MGTWQLTQWVTISLHPLGDIEIWRKFMNSTSVRQTGMQYKLRIPKDLYEWAKETAHSDERPLSYLLIKALEQYKEVLDDKKI